MACGSWLASAAHAEPTGSLPPSEETAKARLNGSPRHGELATVDLPGAPLRVWAVYPERKDRAPVVVVIHEIFGLTDWIRAVADQLAAEGFIALAPDLLSGKGPNGGGTDAYASRDDVTKAVSSLPRDEVIARLNAVRAYGLGSEHQDRDDRLLLGRLDQLRVRGGAAGAERRRRLLWHRTR